MADEPTRADYVQLRQLAEQMKAKLDARIIDGGYLNQQNMRTFVEGCLSLLDDHDRFLHFTKWIHGIAAAKNPPNTTRSKPMASSGVMEIAERVLAGRDPFGDDTSGSCGNCGGDADRMYACPCDESPCPISGGVCASCVRAIARNVEAHRAR